MVCKSYADEPLMEGTALLKGNSAAVKLVTKASQRRRTGTRGRRRKGREALNLRIESFAGNSEGQSFVRRTVLGFVSDVNHPTVEAYTHRHVIFISTWPLTLTMGRETIDSMATCTADNLRRRRHAASNL
ncbi:hypothetical protein EVAR_16845_1 [Eumeta japonica]|uniref:Uncharacterized protein n=1 Tax=Eumeta variegata TaxID=151549 RepID=A0A4C1V350_EUMVA|nr:hypothetical protein EVAR_16845_1 [Eumeta japonica]